MRRQAVHDATVLLSDTWPEEKTESKVDVFT